MYSIKIIHISDIHFSSKSLAIKPIDIKQSLIDFFNKKIKKNDQVFLILSGDITFGAKKTGYTQGKIFFNDIISKTKLKRKNIITCPGNHDTSNSFKDFDIFTYNLRDDKKLKFATKDNKLLFFDNVCFLSINSSYNHNHKYGLVNIKHLKKLLSKMKEEINSKNSRIVVIHHHFLNLMENDTSVIRNGYQTLNLLEKYGFNLILHGHQHTRQKYSINNIKIKGISSPTEERSNSNLIGCYIIDSRNKIKIKEYTFSKDKLESGEMGGLVKYG